MDATCTATSRAPSIASTMCLEPRTWKRMASAPPPRRNVWIRPPYHLDQIRRDAVLEAIQEVCGHRGSRLPAAHVRSHHVHAVVNAEVPPERVMSDFKAYGSR